MGASPLFLDLLLFGIGRRKQPATDEMPGWLGGLDKRWGQACPMGIQSAYYERKTIRRWAMLIGEEGELHAVVTYFSITMFTFNYVGTIATCRQGQTLLVGDGCLSPCIERPLVECHGL
jgi:hypothetical protein